MTADPPHNKRPAYAAPETLTLPVLMGLRPLPDDHQERIHGGQLSAADQMVALRSILTLICMAFVDHLFWGRVSPLILACWTIAAVVVHIPAILFRRALVACDYAMASRKAVLKHAALCATQALIWTIPLLLFSQAAGPVQLFAMWTMASCLMAAISICFYPAPLSSTLFLMIVGGSGVWMMRAEAGILLAAVVAVYALLLLVASIRQALQFGERLITSHQLAEKREVVSLLLKEHDRDGAGWLWQTDAARRLTDVSIGFARLLGVKPADIEGKSVLQVLAGPTWDEGKFDPALHLLAEKLKQRGPFSDLVMPVTVGGHRRWWEISASPRVDEKGIFLGFRGVGSDITEQKESAERIAQMARFDMLTNLPNRLHLTEELSLAIDNVTRWKTRCGFLMIDLDRFKAVNDTLGHLIGDQLLSQVAARLRRVCTKNEVCGRLGGDEFAVVIKDVPDKLYTGTLAQAIIETISKPYVIDNQTLFIGASVGSAISPQDGLTAETLIRNADLAMYRSKEGGGGKHFGYVPILHEDAEKRRLLEIALRDALVKDQLHLVYQPVVDAQTGEVTGFESLVRWTHPELGAISPMQFIPVAEEARLINAIGAWVLHTACREAMNWPADVRVAVNVSPEQLYEGEFIETVINALAHAGLPAHRLELEVTESVFLREGTGALQLLDKLVRMGVCLSLDDFGTGYSSLGYLSRTHFSTIKIDRSFVIGAMRNQRESLAIVRAVVAMSSSLEISTTAEGVESEAEYKLLRDLGCTKIQGYYFGRPMLAADARGLFPDFRPQSQVA